MHGTFNEKITDLEGKKQDQDKKHHQVYIAVFEIVKGNIENHTGGDEYIQAFPLNPVGDVHIGIPPRFYIPYQPGYYRGNNDQQDGKEVQHRVFQRVFHETHVGEKQE